MSSLTFRDVLPGDAAWIAARHGALYRQAGLRITASAAVHSFGQDLVEQTWAIDF